MGVTGGVVVEGEGRSVFTAIGGWANLDLSNGVLASTLTNIRFRVIGPHVPGSIRYPVAGAGWAIERA